VEDSDYPIQFTPLSLDFIHNPSTRNHAAALDTTPLLHIIITLVHDNTVFTGDIKSKIHDLEYCKQLQAKVQKDNHWTDNNFQMVDWDAYHKAIRRLPWSHRISIMKLSHQLWNTNHQNMKYYGQPELCPICTKVSETTAHIYKCQHPEATTYRKEALESLSASLKRGTPQLLLEVILSGLTQWQSTDCPTTIKASTDGSRLPSLRCITYAFCAQNQLGWDSFHRGHLATLWREAYKQNLRPKKELTPTQMEAAAERWLKLLITSVWKYSERLWQFWNQVVHGKAAANTVSKAKATFQARITDLYTQFDTDPYMIPSSRMYLFNRPLSVTVTMGRDAMAAWIRSVEESLYTREHRKKLAASALKQTLHNFFSSKRISKLSHPARKQSLWKPPFLAAHYKRRQLLRKPQARTVEKRSTLRKFPFSQPQSNRAKVSRKQKSSTGKTLLAFGFQAVKPVASVSRQDSNPAILNEFSGMHVSTAP
jgi:hypothetical protein